MPRRGRYVKHETLPDARYNSVLVTRFVNKLMMRGKKCGRINHCRHANGADSAQTGQDHHHEHARIELGDHFESLAREPVR